MDATRHYSYTRRESGISNTRLWALNTLGDQWSLYPMLKTENEEVLETQVDENEDESSE